MIIRKCLVCKNNYKIFKPYRFKQSKFCSRKCYWKNLIGKIPNNALEVWRKNGGQPWNKEKEYIQIKGSNNPNWNGGKMIDKEGYILVRKPEHPFTTQSGYIRKNRLVMEKHLGRYLKPNEIVHHRGIKYPINSIKNKQDTGMRKFAPSVI